MTSANPTTLESNKSQLSNHFCPSQGLSHRRARGAAGRQCLSCSSASIEQSRWHAVVPIRCLLIGPANPEDCTLIVGPPDELQTTRQAVPGQPIGHRQRAALEEIHGT